jgi:subtilisin family serine protease
LNHIRRILPLLVLVLPSAAAAQGRAVDPVLRELARGEMREAIRRSRQLVPQPEPGGRPFGGALALERAGPGSEPRVGVLVRLATPAALDEVRATGAEVGVVVGDIATAWVPLDVLERVIGLAGVERVEAARALTTEHDSSMIAIRADGLRHVANGSWTGATGHGVLVGIYDTGLDVTHEDFLDPAGRTRVVALWDQTSNALNPPPGFTRGFYCTADAIQRRIDLSDLTACPQRDDNGHGTHVSGTAAGDGSAPAGGATQFRFAGVAPDAQLVVVRGGPGVFFENLIVEGLAFMRGIASARNQPMVVNLSLSGQFGPHDGSRLYEQVIDQLSGPGFIVVISAGNTGGNRNTTPPTPQRLFHARGVPVAGTTSEFVLELCHVGDESACLPYDPSVFVCEGNVVELTIWYEATDRLAVEVARPSGSTTSAARGERRESSDPGGRVVIDNGVDGPNPENGDIEAVILIDDCGTSGAPQSGSWRIRVSPEVAGSGQPYDLWIQRSALGLNGIGRGKDGFDNRIIVGSPGNATRAITVGAFATRMCWPSQTTSGQSCYVQREVIGDLARFSAGGPRRDGVLKPELVAPGIGVMSSRSRDIQPQSARLHPDNVHWVLEGTSMSAPHVTGAVALLLQANRDLRPEDAKSLFRSAAIQDAFTTRTYGPTGGAGCSGSDANRCPTPADWWGYGKLNVRDALFAITGSPGTLTISATPALPDTTVLARSGNRLPLLALTFASSPEEPIDVVGLTFEMTGRDPHARLVLVHDLDADGAPDPDEPVLGQEDAPLGDGETRVVLRPETLRVPQGGQLAVVLALELSGAGPHGGAFAAELVAAETQAVGVRSLASNPLVIGSIAGSGTAATSALRSDQLLSLSENPVRGSRVLMLFAETPTEAAIYTVTGRRVADLLPRLEGNTVSWDLTNSAGSRVAPGVYLVVLTVRGQTFREKLVVLTPGNPPDQS